MSEWWSYVSGQVDHIAGPGWQAQAVLGGLTVAWVTFVLALLLLLLGLARRAR